MQADYLGQMRTGAASGVATQYMARPDATEVGLFGSGKQARTQLQAVCKVRKIRRVQVYSPNEERRRRFAAEMSDLCQTEVEPVPRPEMAAEDKDIVITATTSREPVLNGHWIAEGTHINAVGSNFLGKAEVDAVAVRRCESIVVDSKDQARLEAGDFVQALEDGSIHWADVHELGQVIVGRYTGRAHPQDVTLFKSLGIAIEDVAVAAKVYARRPGRGPGQQAGVVASLPSTGLLALAVSTCLPCAALLPQAAINRQSSRPACCVPSGTGPPARRRIPRHRRPAARPPGRAQTKNEIQQGHQEATPAQATPAARKVLL